VLGRLNRDGLSITEVPVSAAANNAIIQMVADKTISGKIRRVDLRSRENACKPDDLTCEYRDR